MHNWDIYCAHFLKSATYTHILYVWIDWYKWHYETLYSNIAGKKTAAVSNKPCSPYESYVAVFLKKVLFSLLKRGCFSKTTLWFILIMLFKKIYLRRSIDTRVHLNHMRTPTQREGKRSRATSDQGWLSNNRSAQ